MRLPNDDTRCNGASCQQKEECKRFTDKANTLYFWLQDALKGCVGFIQHTEAKQQEAKNERF